MFWGRQMLSVTAVLLKVYFRGVDAVRYFRHSMKVSGSDLDVFDSSPHRAAGSLYTYGDELLLDGTPGTPWRYCVTPDNISGVRVDKVIETVSILPPLIV